MPPHLGHHHHDHHAGHSHGSEGKIRLAFFLNLGFAIIELVGGLYTNSVSILSDALHDMGDSLSLALAWYLERYSKRGRDRSFSYGYKRFPLLSALVISIVLMVGSLFVIKASVERILEPQQPYAEAMIVLAIFGVLMNGLAAWRMSGSSSLSDRAVRLHLMEDVLGWVAVLVASVVMYFVELPILDPLLSLGITAWILYNVYHNLKDNFRILLQGVPTEVDTQAFEEVVRELSDVKDLHDLHVWTLNGQENIGTLHLVCHPTLFASGEKIGKLKETVRAIARSHQIHHLTIEIDLEGQSCGLEHCLDS